MSGFGAYSIKKWYSDVHINDREAVLEMHRQLGRLHGALDGVRDVKVEVVYVGDEVEGK